MRVKRVPERYLQDENKRLQAEVERYRAALEAAEPFLALPGGWEWALFKRRALAALNPKEASE